MIPAHQTPSVLAHPWGGVQKLFDAVFVHFPDRAMEAEFKKSCEPSLLRWFRTLSFLSSIVLIWGTSRFIQLTTAEGRPTFDWSKSDPRTWSYLLYMAICMIVCVTFCFVFARLQWTCFADLDWEVVLVMLVAASMLGLWLANPWVICSLAGRDAFDAWGGDPRAYLPSSRNWMTTLLLGVNICSVRAHRYVWLGIAFVVPLGLTELLLPPPFPGDGFRADTLSIVFIVAFACMGARERENRERQEWLRVKALVISVEEATSKIELTERMVDNYEAALSEVEKSVQEKEFQLKMRLAKIAAMEGEIVQLKKEVQEMEDEGRCTVLPLPGESAADQRAPGGAWPLRMSSSLLNGQFNGHWTLITGQADAWAATLDIEDDIAGLADGTAAKLMQSLDGKVTLGGGVLSLEGDVLTRRGRSGRTSTYHRDPTRRAVVSVEAHHVPLPERSLTLQNLSELGDLASLSDDSEEADEDLERCLPGVPADAEGR
eukprot:TRINITY_DN5667_c0_g1_i6.p1 TRINITY_DN5667_c0_g1~~TRINITY_DN5667_c0_g1_i6.p1  ORF type:complete len:487 (-),score=65.94 TRINITY_DN5667_c0_g1_i6:211-1671(-)